MTKEIKKVVEVFKTNIKDRIQANKLIDRIHKNFHGYKANVDLDDCDKILRIECMSGAIQVASLVRFLKDLGCRAEILLDSDESEVTMFDEGFAKQ